MAGSTTTTATARSPTSPPRPGCSTDRWGKGAAWGDYDNDGDPDLYVSNNGRTEPALSQQRRRHVHRRRPGAGRHRAVASFACWWWDYNNDGRLDLFVCNFGNRLSDVIRSHLGQPTVGERPRLFRNEGPGGFRDVTMEAGLDRVLVCMGSNFGDLDNDGYLDMYLGTGRPEYRYVVPNVLFKNVDGRRFEDVTTSSGTGHLQKGHGSLSPTGTATATLTSFSKPAAPRPATGPTTSCS